MRKILALVVVLCLAPIGAQAWWQSVAQQSVGAATPSYSFRNSGNFNGSGDVATYSIDIGTAAADRYIVVWVGVSTNAAAITGVTVNSVALNQDVLNSNTFLSAFYSGLVTTGSGTQTVQVNTTGASFFERPILVWALNGLSSNAVKNSASSGVSNPASANINVTAGDFLFTGVIVNSVRTFNGSTETPAANRTAGTFGSGADWTVASTNAAFNVLANGAGQGAAASYR